MTADLEPAPAHGGPLAVRQVAAQVETIRRLMTAVMREGEHYGRIPGCGEKPVLLKAGAEKLCLTFRLAAEPRVRVIDLAGCHREYRVKCTLYSLESGRRLGSGVGSCSTLESKYRFRHGEGEPTGRPVPPRYWELRRTDREAAQALLGGKGFAPRRTPGGAWEVYRLGVRVEHDNPADHYNTVLKMAKKRALCDAVLQVTGASDLFTQDIEERVEEPAASSAPEREGTIARIRAQLREKGLDAALWPGHRGPGRPNPARMSDAALSELARWCALQPPRT